MRKTKNEQRKEIMIDLYEMGVPPAEIARALSTSILAVRETLIKMGRPIPRTQRQDASVFFAAAILRYAEVKVSRESFQLQHTLSVLINEERVIGFIEGLVESEWFSMTPSVIAPDEEPLLHMALSVFRKDRQFMRDHPPHDRAREIWEVYLRALVGNALPAPVSLPALQAALRRIVWSERIEEARTYWQVRFRPFIEGVLRRLHDREVRVLDMRFGLSGGRPKSFEEIGKALGVTSSRARQIEQRAFEKMRRPPFFGALYLFTLTPNELLDSAVERALFIKHLKEERAGVSVESQLIEHVRTLGLSDRVAGALERAGISHVLDLVGKTERDLLMLRNIGGSALEEIREKLTERGLSFSMQIPHETLAILKYYCGM